MFSINTIFNVRKIAHFFQSLAFSCSSEKNDIRDFRIYQVESKQSVLNQIVEYNDKKVHTWLEQKSFFPEFETVLVKMSETNFDQRIVQEIIRIV